MESISNIKEAKQQSENKGEVSDNVIRETRRIIRKMNEAQKFKKAKAHIIDALQYKHQRHESESLETPLLFKVVYFFQLNWLWSTILYLSGYIFMILAAIDNEHYSTKIGIQATFLVFFWLDIAMQNYLKKFDRLKQKSRYNDFFYLKAAIITLMTIDLIVFIVLPGFDSRPVRPFRILRCFVPLLYDAEMRKILYSFASTYMNIIVYLVFFAIIIVSFGIIGNKALVIDPTYKDPLYPQNIDPYKTNYLQLDKMILIMYVTATYDAYPDNQILALQNYQPNYIFFVVFIIMNFFLFSSIPGELIYANLRETRSKLLIADEIRQQHSLIIAFVTLAENQSNLSIDKLIKFLLYLYRYKIRYIGCITEICLKLDNNNNRSIQVNQFMQLSKILLQNQAMLPPRYDDIQLWISFRRLMKQKFHLKKMVKHWIFEFTVSIIIILSFINAIQLMYNYSSLEQIFDTIFIWIFFVQLMIRIIAIGPENFFLDRWNNVDAILIVTGLVFFFFANTNANGIIKLIRIFRLTSLLRLISHSNFLKGINFEIWAKVKDLFSIMLEILPIIIRFLNLFVFFYYLYGVAAMELFYNFYDTDGSSNYNFYEQYGNFKTLIYAQFVNIQLLFEGGWSTVCNNHVYRAPQYYAYIYLYFILMHITYVYMIAYVIKGIFWEVFFTVHSIFLERNAKTAAEFQKEEQNTRKTTQIMEINEAIDDNEYIQPNTIIKRALIENKFDKDIFKRLNKIFEKQLDPTESKLKSRKNYIANMMIDNWQIDIKDIEISQVAKQRKKPEKSNEVQFHLKKKLTIHQIEEIDEQDFEYELSQLLGKVIINPKIKYSEFVASPKIFVDFLRSKFKHSSDFIKDKEFNLHQNPLHNQESMYYHIYEMRAFLHLETSKREQKAMIIKSLIEQNVISQKQGDSLIKKKLQEKRFQIDSKFALRKVFLADLHEDIIRKFETEYFSDLYGYSFKYINKVTLEPLLKFEAGLTYTLRNIMRYPQINKTQFFEILTCIQDQISNKLLQNGSLFKFIYKLDYEGDIWFTIEYKRHQDMRVHFLKSGIWCYHSEMKEKQTLYSKDVFNWKIPWNSDYNLCEQYIKRFYQNFETLAFGLSEHSKFFESNPKYHIYDLYIQHFDVEKTKRFKKTKIQISKIMVLILSKQEERADMGMKDLSYRLSDMTRKNVKPKQDINRILDQSQDATFQKLKNISEMDVQKIVEGEGIPFAYIINLMNEIADVLTLYSQNFIYQVEKAFNEKYEEMNRQSDENDQNGDKKKSFLDPLKFVI